MTMVGITLDCGMPGVAGADWSASTGIVSFARDRKANPWFKPDSFTTGRLARLTIHRITTTVMKPKMPKAMIQMISALFSHRLEPRRANPRLHSRQVSVPSLAHFAQPSIMQDLQSPSFLSGMGALGLRALQASTVRGTHSNWQCSSDGFTSAYIGHESGHRSHLSLEELTLFGCPQTCVVSFLSCQINGGSTDAALRRRCPKFDSLKLRTASGVGATAASKVIHSTAPAGETCIRKCCIDLARGAGPA
mmetsp:Transcript_75754/g.149733  ORF Transcript_75754/g.149733 Transcript_75754/m.149733 type:complete len:249 (+) Transcript_75754:2512-3258(+)